MSVLFFGSLKDAVYLSAGLNRVFQDLSFYTFFTEGVKTIWFILFLIIAYTFFPLIYKAIYYGDNQRHLVGLLLVLATIALPIILREVSKPLYSNTQIALTRIPLFIVGVYDGKMIKDNKKIPHPLVICGIAIAFVLQYYSKKVELISYKDRYVAAYFGIALIMLLIYILQMVGRFEFLMRVFRFFGKYSLELYLLHITMRNYMTTIGLPCYKTRFYAVMILIATLLSVILKEISSQTERLLFRE